MYPLFSFATPLVSVMRVSYIGANSFEELAKFPGQRNLPPNTGSKASLDMIRGWLEACDLGHKECSCPVDSPDSHPARLIDIDRSPGKFSVVPGTIISPGDRYATLSYRWPEREVDKLQWLRLTVDNEELLEGGLPISNLPRVFQDAILVARHIGIHLLWIDCLCIVQEGDNYQDWDAESARTNVTYQNAYCNLSADNASVEEDEGLFFKRDPQFYERLTIKSSLEGAVTEADWTSTSKDMWRTEVNNSPLNHRGWVFPERVLASRIIHFCRQEIFWECRESFWCESFPTTMPCSSIFDLGDIIPLRQRPSKLWEGSAWHGDPNFPLQDLPYEVWDDAIKEYTKCQFTKPEDKLVAISGPAKYFKDYIKDTYLAGMWRKYLSAELGWWLYPDRERYALGEEPAYYAPSFSWASVKGRINSSGPFAIGILVDVECVSMASGPESPAGDYSFCEDVFGAPLRESSFRLKVSGILQLSKLRWAETWKLEISIPKSSNGVANGESADSQNCVVLEPYLDFKISGDRREAFASEPIYMMHWRYGPDPSKYDMSGADLHCMLLIQKDAARHQFRRAGWVVAEGDEAQLLRKSNVEDILPECFDRETKKHTVYLI